MWSGKRARTNALFFTDSLTHHMAFFSHTILQLSLIAQITSTTRQATGSVYWVDDGTGRIEARTWAESGEDDGGENEELVYVWSLISSPTAIDGGRAFQGRKICSCDGSAEALQ